MTDPQFDIIAMIRASFDSGDKRKIATTRKVAKEAGYASNEAEWHILVGKVLYGPGLGLTTAQILNKDTPHPGGHR